MRSPFLLLVFASALPACGGNGNGAGATPRLSVHYLVPPGPHGDPFEGVTDYRVTIRDAAGVVESADFQAGDAMRLPGIEPASGLTLELEGFDAAATRLSHGRTVPFDLVEEDAEVTLYYARSNTFNDVNGGYTPRVAPSVLALSDGRVVIAGGIAAGVPVGDTDVYDAETDTLAASADMPHPRAFPVSAEISRDLLLVAGGASAAGLPSAEADLFSWDPLASTGSWLAVPPMTAARREAAGAPLGSDQAILVSGSGATGLLASSEIFAWDGVAGSWSAGPSVGKPRKGAVAVPAGEGKAIVLGGWSDDDGGRAEKEAKLYAVNATGGSFVGLPGGSLREERAWPAVIPLASGEWLVIAGIGRDEEALAFAGSTEMLSSMERLLWDGTTATHEDAGAGGVPRRRGSGGVLGDGRVLVLGGDTTSSDGAYLPDAVDVALVFSAPDDVDPLGASPGTAACGAVVPLADGTSLVVVDGRVTRYNSP